MKKRRRSSRDKPITYFLIVPIIVLLLISYFTLRIVPVISLIAMLIVLALVASATYDGFKRGLIYYKHEKERIRYTGLLFSLANYITLFLLIAVFFSFVFITFGNSGNNMLIDVTTGQAINMGVLKTVNFNLVTLTTLGYGNIVPVGSLFESLASFETLTGMGVNLIFFAIAISEIMNSKKWR